MGTTFTGMHVYTVQSIQDSIFSFRSFSEGWQTCTDFLVDMPYPDMLKQIRAFSTRVNAPVLLFTLVDGNKVYLSVYQCGKRVSYFDGDHGKNLYGIPSLFGIPEGGKRRLSGIFACEGETATFLLEEYLGVCLLPFPEIQEENPEELRRIRKDTLWLQHQEAEKHLRGKHSPIRLTLTETIPGKLFLSPFGEHYRVHLCFLLGYGRPEDGKTLHWVRFAGEDLFPWNANRGRRKGFPGTNRNALGRLSTDPRRSSVLRNRLPPHMPDALCPRQVICTPSGLIPTPGCIWGTSEAASW